MRENFLEDMLLIQDPSIFKLYKEMMEIAGLFLAPVFTISLIFEFFGEMRFAEVLKKLVLISVFMGCFYGLHTKAVEISLETASKTLQRVNSDNFFIKRWFDVKVKTKEQKSWGVIESLAIPNLNDLVATGLYVVSKVFIWLLKLIYSSVYHLTYVFAGITAILHFLGWTKDALKGTIQASLWCMLLPFVIVAILALVGNSFDEKAVAGELAFSGIDKIVWLFGITLLLLISPLITYGMVKGEGIHSAGAKMGGLVVSSGSNVLAAMPFLISSQRSVQRLASRASSKAKSMRERFSGSNIGGGSLTNNAPYSSKSVNKFSKNNKSKFQSDGGRVAEKALELKHPNKEREKSVRFNSSRETLERRKEFQAPAVKEKAVKVREKIQRKPRASYQNEKSKVSREKSFRHMETKQKNMRAKKEGTVRKRRKSEFR